MLLTNFPRMLLSFVAIALLAACAAPAVRDAAVTAAAAKPCCASVAELPAPQQLAKERTVELLPSSPHFDFGIGLAPFQHLLVDPSTVGIELRANARAGGAKMFGGDGTFHYADVRLLFLDPQRQPLSTTVLAPPKLETVGLAAKYMLVTSIAVPPGATSVVVTTDPRSVGQRSTASVRVSGGAAMAGGVAVALPGGTANIPYTLSPYGEVTLVVRP